jgi:hypothetical protein
MKALVSNTFGERGVGGFEEAMQGADRDCGVPGGTLGCHLTEWNRGSNVVSDYESECVFATLVIGRHGLAQVHT